MLVNFSCDVYHNERCDLMAGQGGCDPLASPQENDLPIGQTEYSIIY